MRAIYAIRLRTTGQGYVGSTSDSVDRWRRHRVLLRQGKHPNERLQRAWLKHGELAFEFVILEEVPEGDLLAVEQRHIDAAKDPYNMIPAGDVPTFKGRTHTVEVRARISAANSGRKRSPEARARLSAAKTGSKSSPEAVEKMKRGLTGKRRTPEAIENYRNAWPPERREAQRQVALAVHARRRTR